MKKLRVLTIVTLFAWPCIGEPLDLFDGEDLRGWDGDPAIWTVVDGAIVGRVEEGRQVDDHTYLIWQGGQVGNFEMSLKFRSDAGNSGIDYRAVAVAKGRNGKDLKWTLKGYQADIVQNWMGSFYNWGLAGAQPGQFAVVTTGPTGKDEQVTKVFALADANAVRGVPYYKPDQWNDYTITARGEHVVHRINGFQTIELIDVSDLKRSKGFLGLQVHAGNKKQVHMFKEIRLEHISDEFGRPVLLDKAANSMTLEAMEPAGARLAARSDLAFDACTPVGSMVQTEERFSNAILRFQFQRGAEDLNVWLRANEDRGIGVIGIGRGSCRIDRKGDFRFRALGLEKGRRESLPHFDADWDDCEISLIGGELDVKINGRLRARAVDCERAGGAIGLTSSVTTMVRNVVVIPVIRPAKG